MSDSGGLEPHLSELRWRIILSFGAVVVLTFLFMAFYSRTWQFFLYPLSRVTVGNPAITLRGLGPLDGFMAVARFSFLLGGLLALPFVLYQCWVFLGPGLNPTEKKILKTVCLSGFLLFFAGAAIAYFYAVPFMLSTLSAFNSTLEAFRDEWTVERYFGFFMMATCGMGLCFELPLLMSAAARLGLVSPSSVLRYWRQAVLAIFLVAAVLTPPDPASQIFLGLILTALYFTSFFLVKAFWRNARSE